MKNEILDQRQERQKEHLKNTALATQAIRAGTVAGVEQEHNDVIYTTSSFIFGSAAEAAECFSGVSAGNIYSRFTNPTVRTFEQRIAAMEGGQRAVAASSGMAALTSIFLGHLQQGDHIVSSCSVFGSIVGLFDNVLAKLGITTTYVSPTDYKAWQKAIQANTKALFLESPSNPLGEVGDIAALAALAHSHNALLVVDNCFCTPVLQTPLSLGADIVMHSATKYIDGQGRCVGGVAIGSEAHMEPVFSFLRTVGTSMSPFNAWVFINGLETLSLRMQAHCASASKLAHWLQGHAQVERVYYPGLENHPQHALAKQQQRLFGAVVSFEVKGNQGSAWRCIDATQLLSITGNFGDAKSTITHPASTTHSRMTAQARELAGIKDNLIRISVGLEDYQDIQQDLAHALSKL